MRDSIPNLIGTMAVITVIMEFITASHLFPEENKRQIKMKQLLLVGLIGGLFGIYANIAGTEVNGAMITVRDAGPMLSGYLGGPFSGFLAGLICGIHRYFMGGITAEACVIATCSIGTFTGLYFETHRNESINPYKAIIIGLVCEVFHLGVVLLMVTPLATAMDIVKAIAIPFLIVNPLGFALMIIIMDYLQKQRKMRIEQGRLTSDLETAKVLQQSLLPVINENYPCKAANDAFSIGAFIKPARRIGGDFYDFFFVDHNHFAFLISDVSGKGITAAMFMTSSKTTLHNCVRDFKDLPEAISVANNFICSNNETGMFVTSWIGVLDIEKKTLSYICAGHNKPVLIHGGKAEYLTGKSNFILGGMEDMKYSPGEIQLEKGDVLYLYTDGVSEATNSDNELYGEERLQNCLNMHTEASPDDIIKAVDDDINKFVDGYQQADDITMLAIKIN